MLLAHAEALHLHRTKFQEAQQGKIGIVLNSDWFYPFDENSEADKLAMREMENLLGHHLDLFGCTLFILTYLDQVYPEFNEIYITENGFSTKSDFKKTAKMVCDDDEDRTKYHQDHLANILKAMKGECLKKVKGYFVWSWCDNYEWSEGYTARFGLVYIDYMNELRRYPKNSAAWFAKFLKSKGEPPKWFQRRKRSLDDQDQNEIIAADKRLKLVETITPQS